MKPTKPLGKNQRIWVRVRDDLVVAHYLGMADHGGFLVFVPSLNRRILAYTYMTFDERNKEIVREVMEE